MFPFIFAGLFFKGVSTIYPLPYFVFTAKSISKAGLALLIFFLVQIIIDSIFLDGVLLNPLIYATVFVLAIEYTTNFVFRSLPLRLMLVFVLLMWFLFNSAYVLFLDAFTPFFKHTSRYSFLYEEPSYGGVFLASLLYLPVGVKMKRVIILSLSMTGSLSGLLLFGYVLFRRYRVLHLISFLFILILLFVIANNSTIWLGLTHSWREISSGMMLSAIRFDGYSSVTAYFSQLAGNGLDWINYPFSILSSLMALGYLNVGLVFVYLVRRTYRIESFSLFYFLGLLLLVPKGFVFTPLFYLYSCKDS